MVSQSIFSNQIDKIQKQKRWIVVAKPHSAKSWQLPLRVGMGWILSQPKPNHKNLDPTQTNPNIFNPTKTKSFGFGLNFIIKIIFILIKFNYIKIIIIINCY